MGASLAQLSGRDRAGVGAGAAPAPPFAVRAGLSGVDALPAGLQPSPYFGRLAHVRAHGFPPAIIVYDLETTIGARGHVRADQRILEACFACPAADTQVRITLNPFNSTSVAELHAELRSYKQHPDTTVEWWEKLIGARLTDAYLVSAPCTRERDFVRRVQGLLGGMPRGSVPLLVAHNGKSFDHHILRATCARHGVDLDAYVRWGDSLPAARFLWDKTQTKSHTLQHLFRLSGFKGKQTHRAGDDVEMLIRVLMHMRDILPARTPPGVRGLTLERLLMQAPSHRTPVACEVSSLTPRPLFNACAPESPRGGRRFGSGCWMRRGAR